MYKTPRLVIGVGGLMERPLPEVFSDGWVLCSVMKAKVPRAERERSERGYSKNPAGGG